MRWAIRAICFFALVVFTPFIELRAAEKIAAARTKVTYPVHLPSEQAGLVIGQAYHLKLPNGSELKDAVFKGNEGGVSLFEIPTVLGPLRLKEFSLVTEKKAAPWIISLSPEVLIPQNQRELGFSQGLGLHLAASYPFWRTPFAPRLAASLGIVRYTGSRALLSGPEATAGPGWVIPFGKKQDHFIAVNLYAGYAFYALFNQALSETFQQTTFLGAIEVGYGYRYTQWAFLMSYSQNYIYDSNFPFTTGAVRFSVAYFGEAL